jgi:predicted transcriptional regulator
MITDFRTLSATDPLDRAVEHVVAGFQADFPVVDQGRPVGVLTQGALLEALARNGGNRRVGDVMERRFVTADPAEMAERVFERLDSATCGTIPVVRQGRIVGMVTMGNMGEFVAIQEALRSARQRTVRPILTDANPAAQSFRSRKPAAQTCEQ